MAHRVNHVLNQVSPVPASGSVDFDPFSIQHLRALAMKNHYGDITQEVITALERCVSDPSKQLVVDRDLINIVKTNKLTNPDIVDSLTQQSIAPRFAHDRSHFDAIPALVVVSPNSESEVCAVVKVCNKFKIPIHPSGARTGLEGSSLPIVPGVTIDMNNMNTISKFNEEQQLVTVGPGVEKLKLQKYLKERGYLFRVDPGSSARFGGYASTNASGTYISSNMQQYVRCMRVVLPSGEVLVTRSLAPKSSAGYNLQGLLIGSEGTLCIVTEITLSITPVPPTVLSVRCTFPTTKLVTEFITALRKTGYSALVRAELLNKEAIIAVNAYSNTDLEPFPTILLESHLTNSSELEGHSTLIKSLASKFQLIDFIATKNEKEYELVWTARKDALFAALKAYKAPHYLKNNHHHKARVGIFVTDACVPMPELPAMIEWVEKDFADVGLQCPIAAHIADGNFHILCPYDQNDPIQVKSITEANRRLVRKAISLNGSCSGEHGVGIGKMWALEEERGPVAMKMMRTIKTAIDPQLIMNPFKVFTPYTCEDVGCTLQHGKEGCQHGDCK